MTVTISSILDPSAGQSWATAINNAGDVVGVWEPTTKFIAFQSAYIFSKDTFTPLSASPAFSDWNITGSYAGAINSSGEVAGWYPFEIPGSAAYQDLAASWSSPKVYSAANVSGFLGSTYLENDYFPISTAYAINSGGTIAGTATTSSGIIEAATWGTGGQTLLGTLNGYLAASGQSSSAQGINDSGQVVGYSVAQSGITFTAFQRGEFVPGLGAFLWQNGQMQALPDLPGGTGSAAFAINNAGQIAGWSSGADSVDDAVLWSGGTVTDLGVAPGYTRSVALALNNTGQIVGFSESNSAGDHATLWENGAVIDLNSLLPAHSGWTLTRANGINDSGVIVGDGTLNGQSEGFELSLNGQLLPTQAAWVVQMFQAGNLSGPAEVIDSAANIVAALDSLEKPAAAGKLSGIAMTDSGIPSLSISAAQSVSDADALADMTGNFTLSIGASSANLSISGLAGHGNSVVFTGTAGEYTLSTANGIVTVTDTGTGRTSVDHLDGVQALQFSDYTAIVAATPGKTLITSGNITELYAAVFGREPDVPGLAYYQAEAASNPQTPLEQYAQAFLSSPEYTGNIAHHYAQTSAGDAQFIADTYTNLLHRAPASGDVAWYQANVVTPLLGNAAPGTAAYTQAELLAHATVLADFSQSAEFIGDVQITSANLLSKSHWLLLT